nr:MAG TPA: hypothetical protein [Caudoviricetes sp.]
MPHSIRDLLEIVTIFNLPTPISSFLIPLFAIFTNILLPIT